METLAKDVVYRENTIPYIAWRFGGKPRPEALDEKDGAIFVERYAKRQALTAPLVGDVVYDSQGNRMIFGYDWGDTIQCGERGYMHLTENGKASFGGGLNPGIDKKLISETDKMERQKGFWFFSRDFAGAYRDVQFSMPVKVWQYAGIFPWKTRNKPTNFLKQLFMPRQHTRQQCAAWLKKCLKRLAL